MDYYLLLKLIVSLLSINYGGASHVASCIYAILNQENISSCPAELGGGNIAEYGNFVYFYNIDLVKINETITLPEGSDATAKLWNGWNDRTNIYVNKYLVTCEDVSLTKEYTESVAVDDSWTDKQKYEIVNYNG